MYASLDDLDRLGVQPEALSGLDDQTKLTALEAASALADGYIRSQFVLPLIEWGDDLRRAVVSIATYDLIARQGYDPERSGNMTIRDRHDDAIRWLERVANGTVSPAGVVDATPEHSHAGPMIHTPKRSIWG